MPEILRRNYYIVGGFCKRVLQLIMILCWALCPIFRSGVCWRSHTGAAGVKVKSNGTMIHQIKERERDEMLCFFFLQTRLRLPILIVVCSMNIHQDDHWPSTCLPDRHIEVVS